MVKLLEFVGSSNRTKNPNCVYLLNKSDGQDGARDDDGDVENLEEENVTPPQKRNAPPHRMNQQDQDVQNGADLHRRKTGSHHLKDGLQMFARIQQANQAARTDHLLLHQVFGQFRRGERGSNAANGANEHIAGRDGEDGVRVGVA
ncbi:hypothetical protein L5515_005012 [Caenorhabditis briggsae]|uniref:Uncharacterized protein n=1 Tax=Caenorhabditis briggsae TaxID=6238 RepID=A0AAE9EPE0_CAEBR|nr:hypothetical protein L5515_005012 [Caenorhabditis briggsae]